MSVKPTCGKIRRPDDESGIFSSDERTLYLENKQDLKNETVSRSRTYSGNGSWSVSVRSGGMNSDKSPGRGSRLDRASNYKEKQNGRGRDREHIFHVKSREPERSSSAGANVKSSGSGSRKVSSVLKVNTRPANHDGGLSYPLSNSGNGTSTRDLSDIKRTADGRAFTDDSRLSKLVRRLSREDDRERRLATIRQLKEYLLQPENGKIIVKTADSLLVALQEIFYERTFKEVKQEVAQCIGIVGFVLSGEAQRYFQWLFSKLNADLSDEARILLLSALVETLQQDAARKRLADYMPMILSNCQNVLENADHPELLMAVVHVILRIAKVYPTIFSAHFRDTVDILVGWHIDSTQKDCLTSYTSEALIAFHHFWVADMNFSVTLLGQFLEDMEAYAEDLGLGLSGQSLIEEDMPSPDECLAKISALLRVFTTVVKSLGEYFTASRGPPVSIEYMSETIDRIVKCVDTTVRSLYSEKVLTEANTCLTVLSSNMGVHVVKTCGSILPFIVSQIHLSRVYTNHYVQSVLVLTHKVVELMNTQLPVLFINQLFDAESIFHRLRFAHKKEVLTQLMAVYHAIMGLKSVPLLEEAYRYVLGDLEIAFNTLLEATESDYHCSIVTTNPFTDLVYNTKQAEAVVIFDICALAEIGNTKNNLIGMWALTPSIFELLTQHMLPSSSSLMEQFPAVQYALLQALYSHCSRHGNFITSSHLITQNTILEGTLLANVSPSTGGHFTTVLALLTELLNGSTTPYDSRCLCLKWTFEILEALQSSQHIYKAKELVELIDGLVSLGYFRDKDITLRVCCALQTYLNNTNNYSEEVLRRCFELCTSRLSDNNTRVRQAYADLMKLLPVNITTGVKTLTTKHSKKKTARRDTSNEADWLIRRLHMGKVPSGTFHSHNFKSIMSYILYNKSPSKLGGWCWLDRLFHSCRRNEKESDGKEDTIALKSLVDGNDSLLWFWATWEAAQFCILSKLRTPLGKPQETFTTIEAALKNYAAEARNKDLDEGRHRSSLDFDLGGTSAGYVQQLRVCVLLQFMEYLEKLLYNAYEGCAVAMVAPPKTVRTFFRTNRATCQEWLTRIRLCVISVAEQCGKPALVVRKGFEMLKDMKESNNTQVVEFDQVVMHVVQAMSELHCPEAIQGMYTWCKDVIGRKMGWIKAVAEFDSRRYESSSRDFKAALRQYISPDNTIDETRDVLSPTISPVGSPKYSGSSEGLHKWSILGKQLNHGTSRTSPDGPDPILANFLVNQVCESYLKLNDWEEVIQWQETVQQYRGEHADSKLQNSFHTNIDINFIKALSSFDQQDFHAVQEQLELVPGASLDDINKEPRRPSVLWGPRDVVQAANKQFVRAVTLAETSGWKTNIDSVVRCLDQSQKMCEGVLRVGALEWPPGLHDAALMQLYISTLCKNQFTSKKPKSWLMPFVDHLKLDPQKQDVDMGMQAIRFVKLQSCLQNSIGVDKNNDVSNLMSKLRLSVVQLARKQQNNELAERLLIDELCSSMATQTENETVNCMESVLAAFFKVHQSNGTIDQLKLLRMEREAAKLLHCKSQQRDAIETLSSSIVHHAGIISRSTGSTTHSHELFGMCASLNARSLVTLIQWLQLDHKYMTLLTSHLKLIGQGDEASVTHVAKNLKLLLELEESGSNEKRGIVLDEVDKEEIHLRDNPALSDGDLLVGRLLHLATMQCSDLSKAWFGLAGWCYKWGRKNVDNAIHGNVELSTDEKAQVLDLLPKGTSSEEIESVLNILNQIHAGIASEEDICDQDQSLYDDGSETCRRQLLQSCLSLQIASDDSVDKLIEVWKDVIRRVYHYYQLSAKAYFTYLKLDGHGEEDRSSMDGHITATLRVLRLLVKHAWELRGVLEDGLAHTPTTPWKGIIPQLFSRLNHPEAYVRQSVSELLCRVAQDAPHLIVYPAVVGCSSTPLVKDTSRDGLLNEYLLQAEDEMMEGDQEDRQSQEDEDAVDDQNDAILQNCFTAIVDTLAHTNPRMIAEVQLLVDELRRITLLWDELWLGTLNQHHQDVTSKLLQLENEVKRVMNNSSLSKDEKVAIIREKHNTVLKPTVYTIERLHEITSQAAETTHERWFQTTYGTLIEDALQKLKNPTNPCHPQTSWQLFKQIHHSLQQRAQKRSSLILNMEDISNQLASLKNTVISMPGLSVSGQVVTIDAIHHTVQILPTKTKPKKLVFVGSDGKKYPYLFKGLEDLHLDERIMQFLSIVNNMFAKANRNDRKLYCARHYSVTPLGARSGLIQWVDGATPLFSLYKRWQQRETLAQQLKHQSSSSQVNSNNNLPAIPRPSEVYYNKLTPLLKEKGITNLENRKDWPLSIQRRVLEELMVDTPADLLAKELWCSSTSAAEWWQITQTYSRSTAVMSIIGYIIGLGDRHLDNVLVDLATGEVVHIDYNVCFEKGRGLRVPEKVPFRMTHNIETALGVTGIEGTFRICCEYVLKTMRKGRETLLTLLEAFVYDPLVDWTTGNEGGYTGAFYGGGHRTAPSLADSKQSKKDMERQITLSMFSIRMAEMKAAWFKNREEMLSSLPKLQETVQLHLQDQKELQHSHELLDKLQEQRFYLQEAEHDTQHPVFTLQERYEEYAVVKISKNEVQQAIQEKLNDCEHWQKAHSYALQGVQSSKLQKMCAEISQPISSSLASFSPVVEFLQGAGQNQMIGQCDQVSSELSGVLHQRRVILRNCLDVLHTYGTIISHFPKHFLTDNRSAKWDQWLQEVICDFTVNKCKAVLDQFQEFYGYINLGMDTQILLETEARLQNILADLNTKLLKLAERRNQDATETSMLTLQLQEAVTAVHVFITENGNSGAVCMTSVILSALCSLSKRYHVMEAAAAAAGDRLMDLTSREGDWFLDELCSMSGNVNQLLGILEDSSVTKLLSADKCQGLLQAMQTTNAVYLALQDLNVNFRNIIHPEALKTLQSQEESVLSMLDDLDQLTSGAGQTLDSMMNQLEVQLRNAIMGMELTDDGVLTIVKKMRVKFEDLLRGSDPDCGVLTSGQMLLMGFNGLFTRLDADFSAMLEMIGKVQVPEQWRKVDVVKEARSIQMTAFNDSTLGLLENLFFVKQMKAMQDFFHVARSTAATLQGSSDGCYYDDEEMVKPIKQFIAEYIRRHMIGLPSQTLGYVLCMHINALKVDITAEIELRDIGAESKVSLEDLCKKAIDLNLKNDIFEHGHLTQASSMIGSLDAAWRKSDLARRLDNNMTLLKNSIQRAQLNLGRYQWLHEDLFTGSGRGLTGMVMPARATVMSELRKGVQALMTQETAVTAVHERHLALESSINQRLKWAAGANPSLKTVLEQFEEILAKKMSVVQGDGNLANEVITICNSALHFEALRTRTPEALSADSSFLSLMNRVEKTCVLVENCSSSVSEVEEMLVETKPLTPGQPADLEWIKCVMEQLDKDVSGIDNKISKLKGNTESTKEGVKTQVGSIRNVLTTHHKLMSDVRTILKCLSKQEETEYGIEPIPGGIREYVNTYKMFSENFTSLLKLVMGDSLSPDMSNDIETMVINLKEQIVLIYDDLVSFAPPLKISDNDNEGTDTFATALKKSVDGKIPPVSPKRLPLGPKVELLSSTEGAGACSSQGAVAVPKLGTPQRKLDKVTRDPRTGKAIQERNSYAVGVWRRVKMKLDGRDPDVNKRLSVAEQVDYVIKDACNLDNLALLYEGWTPWV